MKRSWLILIAVLIVALGLAYFTGMFGGREEPDVTPDGTHETRDQGRDRGTGRLVREETLYKAGHQWGPPTSFNPFSTAAAWPTGNEEILYETLFGYNLVSGKMEPILGKSMEWTDDSTLTVTLQPNTKWQDGKPLTAEDVVYTFELGKKYSVTFSPVWNYMTEAKVVDDRTIELTLNPDNPHKAMLEEYMGTIRIVPKHIWTEVEEKEGGIVRFANTEPVGSGPYKLSSYSQQQIVMVRDDDYWGIPIYGKPAPKYVVHPVFKSNDAGNLALERGEVDWSQNFIPEVWKMWEDKKLPIGTWFDEEPYHLPGSIPTLWINVNKYPLSLPEVRRALAYSIDYARIAETAVSRYSTPAKSSIIIPEGVPESKYYSEEDVEKYGWEYNPDKAREILEQELGATKGSDGIYVLPDGTRLGPFKAECPYGWTDWMTSLQVVASSARAVGIDVVTEFPEQPVWVDHRDSGNFDLLMDTPAGAQSPAQPWLRIRDSLDNRGVPDAGKGTAYRNFGRYSNPRIHELLDQVVVTTDENELKEIYREINRIYMQDVPTIPLQYRPVEFHVFNEKYWTGFPTADNPVAPPLHNFAGVRVYFNVKPAK
ncbi:MAG: ABC transporter substrate-binding protein [Firmicutes bacterium]|nr:ABC transporter substrate-binding protein [Bacillota bacterium]